MDQEIGRLDSVAPTRRPMFVSPVSTLSNGVVEYGYPTPLSPPHVPTGISREVTPSISTPTSSASYWPRPPHIAIPAPSPSISRAVDNRLDTGAIFGIVIGALAFVIGIGTIVFCLCHRKRSSGATRKEESLRNWIDLESESNISDLDSLPPYDEVKAPELGASAHYTKYVPRTLGRLSPISQMVPPTFDLIKEHHFSSDSSTDSQASPMRKGSKGTHQNISPGYLNDIELRVTPFDTRFNS
ncbi:hypothetical protein C0995_002170 [Termitomyces sp. Mi166|nr:hypothetical protein C0995_002170 [Termitomyces sp. Mi166\